MSYNGSGTFNINSTGQPVVAGTVITASAFNALTTDLATGLTTAITKDGQTTTTARITFAQGITSSLVTDSSSISTGSIITAGGAGIAKNLYVGGIASFSAQPIFTSLTASSAVATDASKGLVSVTNTGTGNNVLATSPTITTPTISSLSSASATALTLQSAGTTAVTVDTSQVVTLSSASNPSLIVNRTASTGDAGMSFQSTGTGVASLTGLYGGGLRFGTGSSDTERMRINSSGNVGIGLTSQNEKLVVNGAIRSTNNAAGATATADSGVFYFVPTADAPSDPRTMLQGVGTASVGASIAFLTGTSASNSERMRIDSSGNLLVGQTSSTDGGGICVSKSANGVTIANFYNSYGSGSQVLRTSMAGAASNTSSYHIVCASGADKFYVYGNGNVVNSNNSYGTLSDVKLKENIVDASSKLADVMQLKVRNFNLKTEPEHKQIGFIAQELEQVFPALIDNTTSPNDPDDVIKSIKTSVLVPILVKAIQELKAINDQQAETINALTARITALENA